MKRALIYLALVIVACSLFALSCSDDRRYVYSPTATDTLVVVDTVTVYPCHHHCRRHK